MGNIYPVVSFAQQHSQLFSPLQIEKFKVCELAVFFKGKMGYGRIGENIDLQIRIVFNGCSRN